MTVVLDVDWAIAWVRLTAVEVAARRDELVELDRQIGDGDHGENMDRGFRAVVARLDALEEPPTTVGEVLRLVATTVMSTVGGAAGALYGTAYLSASRVTAVPVLDSSGTVGLLEAALDGVVRRGKARVGEKTMVDAWSPAVEAARRAVGRAGLRPAELLVVAAEAAEAGAVATDPLMATKGRASYLGERSRGHRDPGAVSSALIVRAAASAAGVG